MLKLHYVPESRAMRPRWLLEEMGVPYELAWMVPKPRRPEPDPRVLVIRSLSPVEAHRGPQGYVLSDQLRLRHRQMFLEAEGKTELPEGCSELLEQKARERFCQAIAVLEEHLAGRKFLVGDRFSAADVVMGAVLGWGRQLVRFLPDFPNCHEYTRAMLGRPAAKKALED